MNMRFKILTLTIALIFPIKNIYGEGAGSSGGLTLLQAPSARASSLGEAFTAVSDDIAGLSYNPSSLSSLKTGQASFLYQKGPLGDDSFGQFMIGAPTQKGSLGLNVGYYNAGEIDLNDGTNRQTVNAQTDLIVALGYSHSMGPVSFGVTGKYISSELIEQANATAYAADFGLSVPVSSRMRFGAALQNIGTQLKYVNEGDDLPRIARGGLSYLMIPGAYATTLLLDGSYYMNEEEMLTSVGLETSVSLLTFRVGYKAGLSQDEFSVGTGFLMGRSSLDYSFGMVQDLESEHRVSLSMKFGGGGDDIQFVNRSKKKEKKTEVVELASDEKAAPARRYSLNGETKEAPVWKVANKRTRQVYEVKSGDTLLTISRKMYGTNKMWRQIYNANRHLISDVRDIKVGQKIIVP